MSATLIGSQRLRRSVVALTSLLGFACNSIPSEPLAGDRGDPVGGGGGNEQSKTGASSTSGGRASVGGADSEDSTESVGHTGGTGGAGGFVGAGGALGNDSGGGSSQTGGSRALGGRTGSGGSQSSTTAIVGGVGGVGGAGDAVGYEGGATGVAGMKATNGGTSSGGATALGGTSNGGAQGSSDGRTPIKVWMAGDSTMAGGDTTACASCPCGWGSQFDPLFNDNVTVVNRAVGGLTIQTWLYQGVSSTKDANGECPVTNTAFTSRWTNMLAATSGMKTGDYLIIQFGINDGDDSCPKHVGQIKYENYLNLMVAAAKTRGVTPILLTPVSAIECTGSAVRPTRKAYFTTATNSAGVSNSVPVIDLSLLSIDHYNSLGFCPNSADYTSSSKVGLFFCRDHTHFERAGAVQIAGVVARALQAQGIGLAAYLR